jgi:hypothetical protein
MTCNFNFKGNTYTEGEITSLLSGNVNYQQFPSESVSEYMERVSREEELKNNTTSSKLNSSELFQNISANPHLSEADSLNVFINAFSEEFSDWQVDMSPSPTKYPGGEPRIFYKAGDGTITEDFKVALDNTSSEEIQMGFIITDDAIEVDSFGLFNSSLSELTKYKDQYLITNPDIFKSVATISSVSDDFSVVGTINKLIRKGLISGKKMLGFNGKMQLVGEGNSSITKTYNAANAFREISAYLGGRRAKHKGMFLEILPEEEDVFDVVLPSGKVQSISKTTIIKKIKEGKLEEVKKLVGNPVNFAFNDYMENLSLEGKMVEPVTEQEETLLRNQLLGFLSDLGFSVTTITKYIQNYKVRNGVDISVEALADMTNQVVAFAEGKMNVENLSEEVAHIIIEGHNQEDVLAILDDVVNTPEWNQYNEVYYEKYSKMHSGEKLDEVVKREILGKILGKSIKEGFEATPLSSSLIQMFTDFLNKIVSYLNPAKRTSLNNFIKKATDIAARRDVTSLNKNNILSSGLVLYSTTSTSNKSDRHMAQARKLQQVLEGRKRNLQKVRDPEAKKIENAIEKLKDDAIAERIEETAKIAVSVHDSLISKLQRRLKAAEKNPTAFWNNEDQTEFRYLVDVALPILVQYDALVDGTNLSEQLERQVAAINKMVGKANTINLNKKNSAVDSILSTYNLDDSARQEIDGLYEGNQKDVSTFQKYYGGLEHSSNIFLNLLGKLINRTYALAERAALSTVNPFIEKAIKQGWDRNRFKTIIKKTPEGENSGYLLDEVDWVKFNTARKEFEASLYGSILTQTQKDSLEGKSPKKDILTESQLADFNLKMIEWKATNEEQMMKPEYYEQREREFQEAGISKEGRQFLSELSYRTNKVKTKYRKGDSEIDYTEISEEDMDELNQIALERKERKSLYDANTGDKKTGAELQAAEELIRLDEIRARKAKTRKTSSKFFDTLATIQATKGEKAAFDFLNANGGITFSEDFWDNFKTQSLNKRLESVAQLMATNEVSPDEILEFEAAILRYSKAKERRTEILKQYGSYNNPAEINASLIPENTKKLLIELEEEMNSSRRHINLYLKKYGEKVIREATTESTPNKAYYTDLADSNLSEIDFLKKHMSTEDRLNTEVLASKLERKSSIFDPSLIKWFKNNYGVDTNKEIQDLVTAVGEEAILVNFAKQRLAPYYKRFAPAGYENLLQELQDGKIDVASFVKTLDQYNTLVDSFMETNLTVDQKSRVKAEGRNNVLTDSQIEELNRIKENFSANNPFGEVENFEFMKVSTMFEWADTAEEALNGTSLLNENFDREKGSQPKLSIYADPEYQTRFNVVNGVATTNKEDWEMIQTLRDLRKQSMKLYGESEDGLAKLPMISKTKTEKIADMKLSGVSEFLKDAIFNRVDDQIYGDETAQGIHLIPKYFLRDLESMGDVSEDLLYSYGMLIKEANLYRQRVESMSDALMLQQELLSKSFDNGKNAHQTNSAIMFKNFLDAYYYGVKQTKKVQVSIAGKPVDVTKVANSIDRVVRFVNVAFSPFIAASSAALSNINIQIERTLGEHLQHDSVKFGASEMKKLLPAYTANIGKVDRTDKLYQLREAMGVEKMEERIRNSSYNRIIRSMGDIPFALMSGLALPHSSQIMLSVLDDFRVVGTKVMSFNEFKKQGEFSGKSPEYIKTTWEKHKDSSVYNATYFKDGVLRFKPQIESLIGEEYSVSQLERIRSKVVSVNNNVDAMISPTDKSMASRHYLMNFTTAHRGYLFNGIQRRFKRQHFNFNTGEFETGHYRSAYTILGKALRGGRQDKSFNKFLSTFKEEYANLSETDKKNLMRVGLELSAFMALTVLSMLVMGYADDEENESNYAVQVLSLMYLRTVSEMGSSQLPTGAFDLLETIQKPFVAIQNIIDLKEGLSFDTVESGAYEGMSKLSRAILKQTSARHFYDLQSAETVKKKMDNYRRLNSSVLLMAQKKKKGEEEDTGIFEFFDNSVRE